MFFLFVSSSLPSSGDSGSEVGLSVSKSMLTSLWEPRALEYTCTVHELGSFVGNTEALFFGINALKKHANFSLSDAFSVLFGYKIGL